MRVLIASLAAAFLLAPAATAAAEGIDPDAQQCQAAFRLFTASSARGTIEVLMHLREGRVEDAIELLEERELGLALADLKLVDDLADVRDSMSVTLAILHAQKYRAAYPRTHSRPEIEREISDTLDQITETPDWVPAAADLQALPPRAQ